MNLTFNLTRESGFRYTCNRCRKCCHNQRIRLTPYELLRLARNRGISTGDLIASGTDEGGTILRFAVHDEDGIACVFLGPEGCTVHPDRPLACRLYPLGRYVAADGSETYAQLPGHPESAGIFGAPDALAPADTVGAYVDSQGVQRYHHANAKYFDLFQRLVKLLTAAAQAQGDEEGASGDVTWTVEDAAGWMDADAVVARYCAIHGLELPTDVESQMDLHIRAMEEWADNLERETAGPGG